MTREEAIKYGTDWLKDEYLDARDGAFIEIALEALEQMPVTTTAGEGGVIYYPQVEGVTPTVVDAGKQEPKILETLDFAINASDGDTTYFVGFRNGLRYSKSLIDGEEPQFENCTEQEPCEDAIDRKLVCAFIDGLISDDGEREKGLEYIRNMPPVETHDKRTETHACDYIHRQDVLDLAKKGVLISNGSYESVCKAINELPSVNPAKTGHCRDCKWWKDSDGSYCRGVHAESKCPINRKEVYEGNGYCYMFEPQERSDKE